MFKLILRFIIYKIIEFIEKIEYRNYKFDNDNPFNKIINIINNNDLLIKTDYGFVPFSEINLTSPLPLYRLELENGDWLECADYHIVFIKGHHQKFVKDLTIDDYVLCKGDYINGVKVKRITNLKSKVSMVDITVDTNERSYYSNNILSHNTISAAILILHFCLFNKDKGVMIVANKGATVVEIIEKIKSIYKLLPFFLKVGIVNWNQSSITFDNGCRIKTDKRTKEPAIGFTIDLLYLDEFAHIPNNIVEPYYTSVVPVVSSVNNSKIIITSTPKGLNLFHKLLTESELPEDDPNWNGYRSLRIYWWQMKSRRNTKIFFNDKKLRKFKIRKDDIKKFLINKGYDIYSEKENGMDGIFIEHDKKNEETNIEFIRMLRMNDLPLAELGIITNWQEQQTKLIGGEDAFKQEFDLHFITGNKMLFDNITIEKIIEDRLKFEYVDIDKFNKRLKIPYNGLQFVKDKNLFNLDECKNYHIGISIDLGEGLGNDYSIINIFRLLPKTKEEIDIHKKKFTDKYDYFKLEQIGIFKSNIYSVKEISDILYMIVFELFDENKVKIALERNTYGDELLAHIPHVFNDNNNYSNHVFLRYKHRIEDKNTKLGIKITQNKKILIKDYQINTKKGNIIIHDQYTINEISTFTRHDLASGDITFRSESGHDDAIMSTIVMSTIFSMISYRDMIDEYMENNSLNITEDINTFIDEYADDSPDLITIVGGYKKVYNNPHKTPNNGNFNKRFTPVNPLSKFPSKNRF
ncbi:terminase large subunit domain-containing protein [Trichloromonas sp.]|uniref:terminase large subunit domain-containing protein n=1 Tax=Trichloromonas sp. TaxID=3069249 RepID=UPI002A3F7FDB|nr:terminase family protein [Trichloromonas sp.]